MREKTLNPPTAEAMNGWRVYRMNDQDWWCAKSQKEAEDAYIKWSELPRDEALDSPGPLTQEEMKKLTFFNSEALPWGDPRKTTFHQRLAELVGGGGIACAMFASTCLLYTSPSPRDS